MPICAGHGHLKKKNVQAGLCKFPADLSKQLLEFPRLWDSAVKASAFLIKSMCIYSRKDLKWDFSKVGSGSDWESHGTYNPHSSAQPSVWRPRSGLSLRQWQSQARPLDF